MAEIWAHTRDRWNSAQADAYISQMVAAIEIVADEPNRGRSCDDLRRGYFRITAGSHFVFYREMGTGIEVVRVLHQRIDHERHL